MFKNALKCFFFPFQAAKKIEKYEKTILILQDKINKRDFDYFDMREKALYWQERALKKKHTVNPEDKDIV